MNKFNIHKKKDDRGSAIIIVLVAVAFVFVLITTLMYITLSNILMKHSDARIKDNFYTAETVVEQIKAGLELKSSESFSEAYKSALTNYSAGAGPETVVKGYLADLTTKLSLSGNSAKWDTDKLLGMVDEGLIGDKDKNSENLDVSAFQGEGNGNHDIVTTTTGLVLKNVYVKYTNPKDKTVSIIQTDFLLNAPGSGFIRSSQLPDIFDYDIIAGQQTIVEPGAKVTSYKSIYGGDVGISINQAALTMDNRNMLVTKGTVSINGGLGDDKKGELKTSARTQFYAGEIEINKGGLAELGGTTTVSDDLVYKGAGKVTVSGSYIGFGNSADIPDESSAILINTKNAEFDASKAKKVVLMGHAFVGENTGASKPFGVFDARYNYDKTNKDSNDYKAVIMGQSVATKADQVAYLIPPDCIGVNDNVVEVGTNPVMNVKKTANTNAPDFSDIASTHIGSSVNAKFKIVDFERPSAYLAERPLKDFSSQQSYTVRYVHSQYGETLAYFYLNLTPNEASEYLKYYRDIEKVRYDKYFKFYEPLISSTEDEAYTITAGQNFTTDNVSGNVIMHEAGDFSGVTDSNVYALKFQSLCAKLVETGVSPEEQDRNIFENVLRASDIEAKVGSGGKIVYTIGKDGTDTVYGVMTGEKIYTYPNSEDGGEKVRLIISTGNVVVGADFKGLIIAKGNLTLKNDIKIYSDRVNLARILQTYKLKGTEEKAEKTLIEYFQNSEEYTLEGIANVTEEDSGAEADASELEDSETIKYSELVHYENYTKK